MDGIYLIVARTFGDEVTVRRLSVKARARVGAHPFWAKAVELDVPIGIHPTLEPMPPMAATHFDGMRGQTWYFVVMSCVAVQAAFTTLFQYGVFDTFPQLRIVILESSAGWISSWLDRMDTKFVSVGHHSRLRRRPSEIFRSQCWISADPDEKTVPAIVDLVGDDRFLWASDYPHSEAKPGIMHDLYELTSRMNERARENLLGASAARLYKIEGRRSRGH